MRYNDWPPETDQRRKIRAEEIPIYARELCNNPLFRQTLDSRIESVLKGFERSVQPGGTENVDALLGRLSELRAIKHRVTLLATEQQEPRVQGRTGFA